MRLKLLFSIFTALFLGLLIAVGAMAFTGPGTRTPGTGNPDFWIKSGNDVFYNVTGGNVGIGTTGPGYKLDVQNGQMNASGGLCIAGDCKTAWSQVQGTNYWTLSGSNLYPNQASYNVGIGTTAPSNKLSVAGSNYISLGDGTDDPIMGIKFIDNTTEHYRLWYDGSTGSGIDNMVKLTYQPTGAVIWATKGGNVGIGNASPTYKLDVTGDVRWTGTLQGGSVPWTTLTSFPSACSSGQYVSAVGSSLTCSTPAGGIGGSGTANYIPKFTAGTTLGNSLIYDNGTNVGIGTASPGSKLTIAGGNLELSGNNITGVNKISVNTIDPVFNINGKKYATYVSDFAGGLRVDTSGIFKLDSSYEIDFSNLKEGSDLWLFWQTSNKNMGDLAIILTPGFDGKAWYEKRENKIIIRGEKSGEISYRLSLPRIDHKDWTNLAEDQLYEGIDVSKYQK